MAAPEPEAAAGELPERESPGCDHTERRTSKNWPFSAAVSCEMPGPVKRTRIASAIARPIDWDSKFGCAGTAGIEGGRVRVGVRVGLGVVTGGGGGDGVRDGGGGGGGAVVRVGVGVAVWGGEAAMGWGGGRGGARGVARGGLGGGGEGAVVAVGVAVGVWGGDGGGVGGGEGGIFARAAFVGGAPATSAVGLQPEIGFPSSGSSPMAWFPSDVARRSLGANAAGKGPSKNPHMPSFPGRTTLHTPRNLLSTWNPSKDNIHPHQPSTRV